MHILTHRQDMIEQRRFPAAEEPSEDSYRDPVVASRHIAYAVAHSWRAHSWWRPYSALSGPR